VGSAEAALVTVSTSPQCPFCDAEAVERVGQWGGQIITAQWRCEACASYFEAIREEFDDPGTASDADDGATPPPR
jgi:transposase-like protein